MAMSQATAAVGAPVTITPMLETDDEFVRYWLAQATLRLRREVCWCWHLRTGQTQQIGIPPIVDPAAENLELNRYHVEKQAFFATDVTAGYLSEQIDVNPPQMPVPTVPGSWARVQEMLGLNHAAQFVLALSLSARADSSIGPIISACMNDASRPFPTLALAQKLWDDPTSVIACADPNHALYRCGLLRLGEAGGNDVVWQRPLDMHSFVTASLLDPACSPPEIFDAGFDQPDPESEAVGAYLPLLASTDETAMQVVPMIGPHDSDYVTWAMSISRRLDRRAVPLADALSADPATMRAIASLAWMRGEDIVLARDWSANESHPGREPWIAEVLSIPVRWYVPAETMRRLDSFPPFCKLPAFNMPSLDFQARRDRLTRAVGRRGSGLERVIDECARRFRFQDKTLEQVERAVALFDGPLSGEQLIEICRAKATNRLGALAEKIQPRFAIEEIVLPASERRQLDELVLAMSSLTEVHYRWGTAKSWNDGGLTVLFYGAPGTGKTMAAEAIAQALKMPIYRIDLSQVVNKYIGETEKNLKGIFDAADTSDCILFFDEADALFGKRTEVRDAHDRFANIEISYLLERMERFKGLAILATNRKQDMDEAFMRRLRYVINFPMPGASERERIWRRLFPPQVDTTVLDFHYLANQFPLSGGHLRSIAFNACLQSAAVGYTGDSEFVGKVSMESVLMAVKRELKKLEHSASDELFGKYAQMMRDLGDA